MSKKLLSALGLIVLFCLCLRMGRKDAEVYRPVSAISSALPQSVRPVQEVRREQITHMIENATLPPSQAELWGKPSAIAPLAAFQRWADDYAVKPETAKIVQGVALARARRAEMSQLIERDPAQALASAVPESVRAAMPVEVRALLEQRVDARGALSVLVEMSPESAAARTSVTRTVTLADGRSFAAYTYGMREYIASTENLPVNGITIDKKLAVSEWPGRVLEPVELRVERSGRQSDPLCPVSAQPTSSKGTETALKVGDRTDIFCGPKHAAEELTEAAVKELLASGGEGGTTQNYLSQADTNRTMGTKKILAVLVEFKDGISYHGLSSDETKTIVRKIGDTYSEWSYDALKCQVVNSSGSAVTFVSLAKAASDYKTMDAFWKDVKAKFNGVREGDFDFVTVLAGNAPFKKNDDSGDSVTWSGIGQVVGKWSTIRVNNDDWGSDERIGSNVGVALHELGHNLGLYHASALYTNEPNGLPDEEYGDHFDKMGDGGGDFNARYKQWLGWLPQASLPTAGSAGVFTLRPMDVDQKSGLRGLEIDPGVDFVDIASWKPLFIEYRMGAAAPQSGVPYRPWDDTLRAYGVQVRMGPAYSPKTWMLDTTPETPNWNGWDQTVDSPLMIGRTFSYEFKKQTVYITNLGVSPESGEAQIEVQYGPVPDNDPPVGKIQASTSIGAVDKTVRFTADVADVEDSDLAYHWKIPGFAGDPTHPAVFPNARSIDVVFPRTAFWQVECYVSDKHGGELHAVMEFRTVKDGPPTITAISNVTMPEDGSSSVDFTVNDFLTPAFQLVTSVQSTNTQLFPAGSMTITGLLDNRTLTLTPAPNQYGNSTVTVSCTDGEYTSVRSFEVTVKPSSPGITVLAAGAGNWKFWDQMTAPGDKWATSTFDDSAWSTGTARFTFPNGAIAGGTVLGEQVGRITTYYRRIFTVPEHGYPSYALRLICDDGAVVYLNGVEVHRQNLPGGAILPSTRAEIAIDGPAEERVTIVPLSPALFKAGDNLIAVEVHDVGIVGGYGDVEFDLELAAVTPPLLGKLSDVIMTEDATSPAMNIDVSDSETPGGPLMLSASSSNPALVRDTGIVFTQVPGSGRASFTITPQPNAFGTCQITIQLSDGYCATWATFALTVQPVNDPPSIFPVADVVVPVGQLPQIFDVWLADIDTPVTALTLTVTSSDQNVLADAGIELLDGTQPESRRVRLLPGTTSAGESTITLHVTDGDQSSTASFKLRVNAALDPTASDIVLLPKGALWLYTTSPALTPNNQPADFTSPSYEPYQWQSGYAQLGFGIQGEQTAVPASPLRITTYFRSTITVPNPAEISALTIKLRRDDGAAVYINGTRVVLSNLPPVIHDSTPALSEVIGNDEFEWHTFTVGPEVLVPGVNVVAAEVHQDHMPVAFDTSDLSFDLEISATPAAPVATSVLITPGDYWTYFDKPGSPGADWRSPNFFPATPWASGLAPLGYGTGAESTVVNWHAADPWYANPSVSFRKQFEVADPSQFGSLHLFLRRDDSAIIFINGQMVLTDNIVPNANHDSYAMKPNATGEYNEWKHFIVDPGHLVPGTNVITVDVHQHTSTVQQLFFDLQFVASFKAAPTMNLAHRASNGGSNLHGNNTLELRWPAAYTGWKVEHSMDLVNWSPVTTPPLMDGAEACLTVSTQGGRGFYRLVKP